MSFDLASAEEGLKAQIYTARRELRRVIESKGIVSDREYDLQYDRARKKLDALKLMLKTVEERRSSHLSTFAKPDKKPFQSTEMRPYQKLPKISDVPNFYKGDHEWIFGYQTRCKSIEMDSFQFSDQYKFDRQDEALNDVDVMVGARRPISRYRDTDFYPAKEKSMIKLRLGSPPRPSTSDFSCSGSVGSSSSFSTFRSLSPLSVYTGDFSKCGSLPTSPILGGRAHSRGDAGSMGRRTASEKSLTGGGSVSSQTGSLGISDMGSGKLLLPNNDKLDKLVKSGEIKLLDEDEDSV